MIEHRPTILVVDDVAANCQFLARQFERRGFEVTEADSGLAALELIDQRSFDLVLLDVVMPHMNGLQVLKRIRQRHSEISLPVIMVSGNSQDDAVAYALATGANDYLTKPVDFAVALARTNTQLERKRAKEAVLTANESLRLSNENQGTTIL